MRRHPNFKRTRTSIPTPDPQPVKQTNESISLSHPISVHRFSTRPLRPIGTSHPSPAQRAGSRTGAALHPEGMPSWTSDADFTHAPTPHDASLQEADSVTSATRHVVPGWHERSRLDPASFALQHQSKIQELRPISSEPNGHFSLPFVTFSRLSSI